MEVVHKPAACLAKPRLPPHVVETEHQIDFFVGNGGHGKPPEVDAIAGTRSLGCHRPAPEDSSVRIAPRWSAECLVSEIQFESCGAVHGTLRLAGWERCGLAAGLPFHFDRRTAHQAPP